MADYDNDDDMFMVFSPQKKNASGDALDASVLSFRDIVDDPDIDCDGTDLIFQFRHPYILNREQLN